MRVHWRLFKQKRVPVSLLHLPDELLLQVIDELGEKDLYALSVQCKCLQRICLPPYLVLLGVTTPLISPIDHLVITREQFYAPGIPLAFFGKTVRSLSLGIHPPLSVTRTEGAIQRLRRMITTIEGLEDLALYFDSWYFNWYVDAWHPDSFKLNPEWWQLTTEGSIRLLEVVAKRCISLTLSHHGPPTPRWQVGKQFIAELEKEATKWIGRPLLVTGLPRKRPAQVISRSRSSYAWANYPRGSSTLTTLVFWSNTFLLPPFSSWAFKILNTAPLTRLDLVEVNLLLAPAVSALVFGALTLPALEYLRIINCRVETDAISAFLSRHSTISTFDITCTSTLDPHEYYPITTLPALVSLRCDQHHIRLLWSADAFPKLAHLRVVIYLSPHWPFTFDVVENSLGDTVNQFSDTYVRLCLEILPQPNTELYGNWTWNQAIMYPVPTYVRCPVLSQVREIAFGPDIDAPSPAALPAWLSVFPLLEHIEFLNAPVGLDHQAKMSLVRLVLQTCPRIRSVRIGEDTRDVSAWMCSDND